MRVLCAAISGPGHLFPVVAVACELQRRGHDVVVASSADCEGFVSAAGPAFEELPDVPSPDGQPFRPYELARTLADGSGPIVERVDPDATLCDGLCLGVAMASELRGAPWATIYPHPLPFASRDLAPFGSGRAPRRGVIGRRRDDRARARQGADFEAAREECNAVRAVLGLEERADATPAASDDLILVATPRVLEPERSDWPAHATVVGPCLWEPPQTQPVRVPDGDGPIVLVAPSTSHDSPLARHAIDAALALGCRVIVTGSGEHAGGGGRVVYAGFAAHSPLLKLADAVVCNVGGGILARAMTAGVPVVALPQHGDQKENAARAARLGIAIVAAAAHRIEPSLRRVIADPMFAANARRIARDVEGDGPERAAALIEQMAKTKGGGLVPAPLPNGGLETF